MSIRHVNESTYMVTTDHADDGRPSWRHRSVWLHAPRGEARAEWDILGRNGFGWGFKVGRNGSESDLGLDLHAGRLASLWLRMRTPWTGWLRVRKDGRDGTPRYYARHTSLRFAPFDGCIASVEVDNPDGYRSRDQAWWREMKLMTRHIVGKTTSDTTELDSGTCVVPMPEGPYPATYKTKRITKRHTRFPGTLLDLWRTESWVRTDIDVPGGIPVEGKGENSWDCGMGGTFSLSALGRVHDAIGALVASVQRDRDRYGGPHNLTMPTSVRDAS